MDKEFFKNLRCPECRSVLEENSGALICLTCGGRYKITNGTPDFRKKDGYWCNVSREKMQELNKLAREGKDWLSAAEKVLPRYSNNFKSFSRADFQFLWPTGKNSKILDIGSMWGGVSVPASQYNGQIYAVDKTAETLEFLDIRAKQMGIENIKTVACSAANLPFPDNFFDMVILCGVLEWVGVDENIILEKQWGKIGRGLKIFQTKKYKKTPTEMQIEVLKEAKRVLKPGGSLFLATENRMGYIYFAGWPDEHMNLPFVCFLPRFLANFITKLFLGSEYRTYVYTMPQLKSLLQKSGFSKTAFYGAFHHYINPTEVIPIELISSLHKKISAHGRWQLKVLSKIPKWGIIPPKLLKYFSPSIICFAYKKADVNYEPRIKQALRKAGIINSSCQDFKAVKHNSRPENNLPVNYLVYTNKAKNPTYFCKICRDKKQIGSVKKEAENLRLAESFLKDKEALKDICRLIYFGTIDDLTFLVEKYVDGNSIKDSFWGDLVKVSPAHFKLAPGLFAELIRLVNKYAAKKWLKKADLIIMKAITLLNDLQKASFKERMSLSSYYEKIGKITLFKENIPDHLQNILIPLSMQHGDYDICNILVQKDKINLIDFEHAEACGSPFFDLGNLLFNDMLIQWKAVGRGKPLKDFATEYGWAGKIDKWVKYYSRISGISMEILAYLPALAALEQNSKIYPSYRKPDPSYPMYGEISLGQMLKWKL